MECLPETGLSSGATLSLLLIALAALTLGTLLIVRSRRARTGTLLIAALIGGAGLLPLGSAPSAHAGIDCNGTNAVYITETAPGTTSTTTETTTKTAAPSTITQAPVTVTQAPSTVTHTATETVEGPTTTQTVEGPTTTITITETATVTPSGSPDGEGGEG